FYNWNGAIYFVANDGVHGQQLWKTDGTTAGTLLLKTVVSPNQSEARVLGGFFAFNGVLYFGATDGFLGTSHGVELWRTDGTEAGTFMLKDINPGIGDSGPRSFAIYNNELYFDAFVSGVGRSIWMTDGTQAGTQMVADPNASTQDVFDGTLE